MLENLNLKRIAIKLADDLYPNNEDINRHYLYRTGAFDEMSELESIANEYLIIINRLKFIEGAFMIFCKSINCNDLSMVNNGKEIYFFLHSNSKESERLNRYYLESLSESDCINLIYDTLKQLATN